MSGFLISGSVVCAMVTTHDSVSVVYDNNGLESRSDGDCPYGQNLSLRLFRLRHCGSTTYRLAVVVVLSVLTISYLVDPASSHMLVSKIKPCMSKYKPH